MTTPYPTPDTQSSIEIDRRSNIPTAKPGRMILVTGGARSGKSRYAQDRAAGIAPPGEGKRVLFVATAEESDAEMRARIARHRRDRPPDWETLEVPLGAAQHLAARSRDYDVIVLDCLTLFVSNLLLANQDLAPDALEAQMDREIAGLCRAARSGTAVVILVTNEVGMGLHPMTPLGRRFQDLAGRANQQVAAAAEEVVLMICGLPMQVKG
jgi:adenosylcobinamide kinase/adenosylcobinamide-phosphate guanylyltransferase